jgi:integrase
VSEADVAEFVEGNACVRDFLNRYDDDGTTYVEKAVGLARFFRWLQVVKGLKLTPEEFLDTHLQKRSGNSVEGRRWALRLALEYSRDNPDLKGKAANYVYAAFFLPVKLFCDYHEAPLTTVKGFFPKRGRRKYQDKPFTVDFVKQAIGVLSQRDRTICMIQLQSGQAIKQVLIDINQQCKRIFREIDQGAERIRFDFRERKGNGFAYYTYISRDAIQEIRKWRPIREQIIKNTGKDSEYLFITDTGKPLPCKQFHNALRLAWTRHKLRTGPLSVRSHGFRKFFEQESSPPERGISKSYITFMMGHSSGNGEDHKLDVVGGVYDHAPQVYPDAVEKEYEKLEPYLNIYSSNRDITQDPERDKLQKDVEALKVSLTNLKREMFRREHNLPVTSSEDEIDRAMTEEEASLETLRKAGYLVKLQKDGSFSKSQPNRIFESQ